MIGAVLVLLAGAAVIVGTQAFTEKQCLERWFLEETVICKDCVEFFGEECLGCFNSTKCDNCTAGTFWASNNDTVIGIVAETEIRCRNCTDHFGLLCLECD